MSKHAIALGRADPHGVGSDLNQKRFHPSELPLFLGSR